jgi:hypothetical protein
LSVKDHDKWTSTLLIWLRNMRSPPARPARQPDAQFSILRCAGGSMFCNDENNM